MNRLLAVCLVGVLTAGLGSGCGKRDPLRVGTPSVASPAAAPSPTASPPGTVWLVPGATSAGHRHAEGIAMDPVTGRIAVGVDSPPQLAIIDATSGRPLRVVNLQAPASHVVALPGGGFRAVGGRELVTVPVKGEETRVKWSPPAHGLALLPDGSTAVTFPREGQIGVYAPNGDLRRTIRVEGQPDGIAALGDRIGVVDAEATSLTVFHASTGEQEEALRAGNGALHVAADSRGRFVVADTRDGELLIFSVGPLYLRQRYPVPGSPYGLAYDSKRQVMWVTLTARNEVVGFDLSGGAPKEVARHPTVRQPNSVAVDPETGRLFVAGQAEGVVQSISG
ncbi:MAG: YncE family protein [Micromonosporaceae bacterium]